MTLHALNLCTTLTFPLALARYKTRTSLPSWNALGDSVPGFRKVDITNPSIVNVLANLAEVDLSTPLDNDIDNDTDVVVKILPPVHVRVVPPPTVPTVSRTSTTISGEMIDRFMTNWTRLVGDPVLSKWIVLVLAVSVALNGYLLKGIAEGSGRGLQPQGVRFRSIGSGKREQERKEEEEAALVEVQKPADSPKPPKPTLQERRHVAPLPAPLAIPATPSGAKFILDTVDAKLRQQEVAARHRSKTPPPPTSSASDGEASLPKETANELPARSNELPARSLEECMDVFENGPRPVSLSLALLSDEEVILLAQHGKIAAYALEKLLGNLDRAVFIRRALICEFLSTFMSFFSNSRFHMQLERRELRL